MQTTGVFGMPLMAMPTDGVADITAATLSPGRVKDTRRCKGRISANELSRRFSLLRGDGELVGQGGVERRGTDLSVPHIDLDVARSDRLEDEFFRALGSAATRRDEFLRGHLEHGRIGNLREMPGVAAGRD